MSDVDLKHMTRALELARAQLGCVAPNPAVGCVIVRDAEVVGEGATGDGGRPHAEEVALLAAGNRAAHGVAYVTLEPCARRTDGSPSCAQRLVDAGVDRVVFACDDPHAHAAGLGVERLKGAGIAIDRGMAADEARLVNVGFFSVVKRGRPWIAIDADASSYDADLELKPDELSSDALKALAKKGLTRVCAAPGSEIAKALRDAKLVDDDRA